MPTDSELDWVLVLATFRKDADYRGAFLREHNIDVKSGRAATTWSRCFPQPRDIMIISHEALNPAVVAAIAATSLNSRAGPRRP
ncbi:hypothetical protein LP421_30175 (plasmid) [Rhizobium sp. RCAM05350]|nr:hypothetical protein LP421_30175 [Rhizobium sp. RCAM05350]